MRCTAPSPMDVLHVGSDLDKAKHVLTIEDSAIYPPRALEEFGVDSWSGQVNMAQAMAHQVAIWSQAPHWRRCRRPFFSAVTAANRHRIGVRENSAAGLL